MLQVYVTAFVKKRLCDLNRSFCYTYRMSEITDPNSVEIPKVESAIPLANPAEIRSALSERVELVIEPGRTLQWEDFQSTAAPNSIAIDGYVEGPIQRDLDRQIINLNHHERVDRSSTLATCQQALFELRKGLYGFMSEGEEFKAQVFMNDCDEDVCTTVFLLRHPEFAARIDNPALNRLVEMEGVMDVTGGFYPWPQNYPSLKEFFWVYEPYHNFRNSGGLGRKEPQEYQAVIDEVGDRIEKHISGQSGSIQLDTRYQLQDEKGILKIVREEGKHAKVGMLSDGIQAFISVSDLPDGKYKYSIGRLSPYVPFDINGLYEHLNQLEGFQGDDKWGGGDTIGGSPRETGSAIAPEQLAEEAAKFIKQADLQG